jgi:hypothetical protein
MTTFTIDTDNNITAHMTFDEGAAVVGAERFTTSGELAELAASWPAGRLVEIWNSLPGVSPVESFKNTKTSVARIWKRIQGLGQPAEKATQRASPGVRKPHVARAKAKSRRKTRSRQARNSKQVAATARTGSKKADIIALLQRPKGATLAELMEASGWQAHSVRGLISGTLGKKEGLKVMSGKGEDGERVYSLGR